jgi:hypothetical protein
VPFDQIKAINELEESIRKACTDRKHPLDYMNICEPLAAERFNGPYDEPGKMTIRPAIQHALYYLEQARKLAAVHDEPGVALAVGVAAGIVLPFGIVAGYRLDPITVYPAVMAPAVPAIR